jgi:hypothetical protein
MGGTKLSKTKELVFIVVKTLLRQLVYKERGASKHRKIGNYEH